MASTMCHLKPHPAETALVNPITYVICFAVRQTCGVCVKDVAAEVEKYYRDHSAALPKAIERATEQAWRALAVALAGDGWVDRVKIAVAASGDEKAFREQVKRFLADGPLNLAGREPERFRRDCLTELTALRRDRTLLTAPPPDAVARTAADFRRFDAPGELAAEAGRAAAGVADVLAPRFPNLAELLRTPPPLLAVAFAYFFRKAVAADDDLFDAIQHDAIQSLTAGQLAGFQNLDKALKNLGDGFDTVLDEAVAALTERIEAARLAAEAAEREARRGAAAAAGAETAARDTGEKVQRLTAEVLDLRAVLASLPAADAIRRLVEEVIRRELRAGMAGGSLRPQDAVSIRGDDERRAIRQLLDRYRQLPEEERKRVPAVLNGLGKLLHGAGDFPEARRAFAEVVELTADAAARAEALANAYRTALEQKRYDEALAALRQAVALDGRRAPFPMDRFEPVAVLGAGGFGTVFRCRDANFRGREVAVKALHADDLDRGIDEVFAEAHALIDFSDPAVVRVRDAEFADRAARRGPYLVMEYFPGSTLAGYVGEPGPVPPAELLPLARQVAAGLARVHRLNILHRDLKPDNVLVRRDADGWQVRVIDFGLAVRRDQLDTQAGASSTEKSLHQASVVGTMRFAPPEQRGEFPAERVGRWSDVYGFGRTFLFAWFGVPQPGKKVRAAVPDEWRPLFDLLEECVEHDPDDRPRDFDEVLRRLDALTPKRAGEPVPPVLPQAVQPPPVPAAPLASHSLTRFACPQCHKLLKSKTPVPVDQKVKCPKCQAAFGPRYAVRLRDELKVYEAALTAERTGGVQLAPHALEAAAVWAVLTRLEATGHDGPTPIQKLRLYDGEAVEGYTAADAGRLQRESPREGTFGVDPQYVMDRVADAAALTRKAGEDTVHPLAVLRELGRGLDRPEAGVGGEQVERFRSLLDLARGEHERVVWGDFIRAVTADEDALARLCRNYIDNVKAYTQGEKVRNRYTGLDEEPDERLMRSVEGRADVPDAGRDAFRRGVMNCIGALAIEAIKFDYQLLKNLDGPAGAGARTAINSPEWGATLVRLREALKEKLAEDMKDSIKRGTTTPIGAADKATQEKFDILRGRLIRFCGYTEAAAADALELSAAALRGEGPPDPDALLALARTHFAAGRGDAAQAVAAAAVRLAPDRADAVAYRDQCGPGKPC